MIIKILMQTMRTCNAAVPAAVLMASRHQRQRYVAVICILFASACGPNQRILNSSNESDIANASSVKPVITTFEQDLAAMRTADFSFIYVIRRKDGSVLDTDDKRFLGAVISVEVNRRIISDGGKAVILGSNFSLPSEIMKALTEKYIFEDHSKPDGELNK